MGRYRMLSMEVESKDHLRWAKEMLIVASWAAGMEITYLLDVNKDDVVRYLSGTLSAAEQKKFSAYFTKKEAQQNINWSVEGKKTTAFPALDSDCFSYMGGYYGLCEKIVTANPKLEFVFTAQYEDTAAGLSSGTTCKVKNGKFYYETGEYHPWIEDPEHKEQYHIVEGELVNGKYKFEVVSEFDEGEDCL